MVFQSPNSLSTVDNTGSTVATAQGYRLPRPDHRLTNPGGVQALYAGGVTSGEMFECHPRLISRPAAPRRDPGRRRASSVPRMASLGPRSAERHTYHGTRQQRLDPGTVRQHSLVSSVLLQRTAPTYAAGISELQHPLGGAALQPPGPSFTCAQDGVLFFQVGDFPGVGRVFASAPGVNPALGDNCVRQAEPASPGPARRRPPCPCGFWTTSITPCMRAPAARRSPVPRQVYGVWSTNGAGQRRPITGTHHRRWRLRGESGGRLRDEHADLRRSHLLPPVTAAGWMLVCGHRPAERDGAHPSRYYRPGAGRREWIAGIS